MTRPEEAVLVRLYVDSRGQLASLIFRFLCVIVKRVYFHDRGENYG